MLVRPELEALSATELLDLLFDQEKEMEQLRSRLDDDNEAALSGPRIRLEVTDGVIPRYTTPDGWTVATVRYDIVPGYDFAAACEGMSDEAVRQEILIDWTATRGKRVYPEYGTFHQARRPLKYDPRRPLYCGWDFGSHAGGTPAWVPTQVNTFGQWLIFPPIAPLEEESIGTYEFGQIVADHLQSNYASPNGLKWRDLLMEHYGDPNGAQRPPRTGDRPREMASHFEILDRGLRIPLGVTDRGGERVERKPGFGFKIKPGPVNVTDRLEPIRARLRMVLPGGLPAVVVDPRATVIKDGFSGGYAYKKKSDGGYEESPDKNWYSHSFDGLAYICACKFAFVEETDADNHTVPPQRRFRSQAAGRLA